MVVERTVKVKLTKEEKATLEKAHDIVNEIWNELCDSGQEVEFEDNMDDLLDDMQAAIRCFI